jgi:C1A family cysteine protease
MRRISRYGWVRDLPDPRDRLYHLEEPIRRRHQLPARVEPLTTRVPRWNQGQLGSCTAHGIVRVLAYEALKQGETLALKPGMMANGTYGDAGYSRLFVYYNERAIEGTVGTDAGAQIRDGIKTVAGQGAAPEASWPYDPARFASTPPPAAYKDAVEHKALRYRRITPGGPGAPVHTALANGLPVVFGFPVPSYFESGWNPAGVPLPLPGPDTTFIGAHCVVATGYDLAQGVYTIDNSWGEDWGVHGRFEMEEGWLDPARELASDLWVVERVS